MTVGDKGKSQGEGTIKGKENNHWTGDWRGKVKQEREKWSVNSASGWGVSQEWEGRKEPHLKLIKSNSPVKMSVMEGEQIIIGEQREEETVRTRDTKRYKEEQEKGVQSELKSDLKEWPHSLLPRLDNFPCK